MSRIQKNVSLKPYNTFGIDASASLWFSVEKEIEVTEFLIDNLANSFKVMVLGGGSNVLFTQDFDGIILHNAIKGIRVVEEDRDSVVVEAGGGENWHSFVMHCVEKGWGGIENLSLIPGSVGAAPIQNIGAYGVELKDVFHSLDAIHLTTGQKRVFEGGDCQFGYRDSVFKRGYKGQYFITKVRLRLEKHPQLNVSYGAVKKELEALCEKPYSIGDVSKVICGIRNRKLPNPEKIGNSGSFFKNPIVSREKANEVLARFPNAPHYIVSDREVKLPAGWLIQECGWKGKRFGNYGVYPYQALVLVNYGGANGRDIFKLSQDILESVEAMFGIRLEREVNVV